MTDIPLDFFLPPQVPTTIDYPTGYGSTYRYATDFADTTPADGKVDIITGQDVIEQLSTKALKTRRATYLVYGSGFGQDIGVYLDSNPPNGRARQAYLEALVLDCLMALRLVDTVEEIDVEVTSEVLPKTVALSCTLVTIFSDRVEIALTWQP